MWNLCRIKKREKNTSKISAGHSFIHLCWYQIQAIESLLLYSSVPRLLLSHFTERQRGLTELTEEICDRDNRELDPIQTQILKTGLDFFSRHVQSNHHIFLLQSSRKRLQRWSVSFPAIPVSCTVTQKSGRTPGYAHTMYEAGQRCKASVLGCSMHCCQQSCGN